MTSDDFNKAFRSWVESHYRGKMSLPSRLEVAQWAFEEGKKSATDKVGHAYHQYKDEFWKDFEEMWSLQQGALFLKEENSSKEWKRSIADYFAGWGVKWAMDYIRK